MAPSAMALVLKRPARLPKGGYASRFPSRGVVAENDWPTIPKRKVPCRVSGRALLPPVESRSVARAVREGAGRRVAGRVDADVKLVLWPGLAPPNGVGPDGEGPASHLNGTFVQGAAVRQRGR